MKIYLRIIGAYWSTFGVGKELFSFILIRSPFFLFRSITFFLDNLFFPGYRRIKIEKPIFIIGHPRSGTTFLHQFLTQNGEFAVFETWQILLPSLIARKMVSPLIKLLIRKKKDTIFPITVGHEVTLRSIEEEEYLFLNIFNTQFMTLTTPLGFSNHEFLDLVYSDYQPPHIRKKTMRFFKQCLQRQIYYSGKKQILTKMNYSGMRIQSILETFPDAKFIYLIRSPLETIPSHLSLDRNALDHHWGLKNIPVSRLQRYYKRRYDYDVRFYRYIEEVIDSGTLSPSQFITLSYDLLKNDFGKAIEAVLTFCGIEVNDELGKSILEQTRDQKSYRPSHQNLTLEDFGLTKEKVIEDLSFIFDRYGFKK